MIYFFLWSCCLTIALCVGVSTHPKVPSPKDKWYYGVIDRLSQACIGLLGPDYLFALAGGQLFNARRSVKVGVFDSPSQISSLA